MPKLEKKGGGVKVTRPKTETSIRRISLSQETVEILKKEHEKHPDIEYMSPSPATLGMYCPDSVTAIHNKILKSAGFTLRTYTHVTTKMQEKAAATMGKLIGANV